MSALADRDRALLLSSKEAAALIGFAEHTLRVWRSRGTGPAYIKVGNGRVKYSRDAIQEWLDANTRGGSDVS